MFCNFRILLFYAFFSFTASPDHFVQAIVDRAAQLNIAVSNPMGRLRKEEHA